MAIDLDQLALTTALQIDDIECQAWPTRTKRTIAIKTAVLTALQRATAAPPPKVQGDVGQPLASPPKAP